MLGRYTVDELHEVRTHLEVPAAGLAARRAGPEQVQTMQRLVDEMESCAGGRQWAELDAQFHEALASATGNEVFIRLVADLADLLVENSHLANASRAGRILEAKAEHKRVLEAVVAGDASAAERAMWHHLRRVSSLLHKTHPEPGDREGGQG